MQGEVSKKAQEIACLFSPSAKLGKKIVREMGSQVGRNNFTCILIKIKSKLPWAGSRQPRGRAEETVFPCGLHLLREKGGTAEPRMLSHSTQLYFTSSEVKWLRL